MKKILFFVLSICLCSAMISACDEDDPSVKLHQTEFNVGTVNWSSDVNPSDKAVITELLNNMVEVEACEFHMGAQGKSSKRPNYHSSYSNKDTIWDENIAHLIDTLKSKHDTIPYALVYYNAGIKVGPVIDVTMPDYYIGKFEITQAQWTAVMHRDPTGNYCKVEDLKGTAAWYDETGKGDDVAAYNISYDDAVEFCQKLSQMTGLNFRLPTEAEWECAARGGKACKGYRYSGSDSYSDVGWCYSNACSQGLGEDDYGVHAGGELDPNELGIYDMSGNVAEWVANSYYEYSYHDANNPQGRYNGDTLILRGGSWTQTKYNEFCPGNRRKFIKSSYSAASYLDAIAYCGFRIAISK